MFQGDSYHTPADLPRSWPDRLALNTRLWFQYSFVRLTFSTRAEAIRGTYDTRRWVETSQEVFRLIEQCGGRFHITGLDHLRDCPGPAIILSNHMSVLETMVFPGIIQPLREVTFVVKDSLVRHPIFGSVMRTRDPIVLHRSNPRDDLKIVMEQGMERIKAGRSLIIFPQSTRKTVFNPGEFNSIGTKLASRAGVPVIPAAIKTDFWQNSRLFGYLGAIDRRKPVMIKFGAPIPVPGNNKDAHQQVVAFIDEHLKMWE